MILSKHKYGVMELGALAKLVDAEQFTGVKNMEIRGIAYDSRLVEPNMLFVALPGTRADGRQFVDEAIRKGAVAVMYQGKLSLPRTVSGIQVRNARKAMALAAAGFNNFPADSLTNVGITGTNGKTTIAFMVRDLLRAYGLHPGMLGTVRYEIGDREIPANRTTPESPELQAMLAKMRIEGCQAAVMEVSSHALAQDRTAGIPFTVGVFTNLTHDHLDYHESLDEYFEAKATLIDGLGVAQAPGCAVINLDDPRGLEMVRRVPPGVRILTYGLHPEADIRAHSLQFSAAGTAAQICTPWGEFSLQLRLLGRFNILNALAALGVAGHLGMSLDAMQTVLQTMPPVPGRLEPVSSPQGRIFVDYAHTPDALKNVLETLREFAPGRILVTVGCGGDRDREKRPLMAQIAETFADLVVLTSDNPRSEDPGRILQDMLAGCSAPDRIQVIPDRQAAIEAAVGQLNPDDFLLIAGKGHETYQENNWVTIPFDDRLVARSAVDLHFGGDAD